MAKYSFLVGKCGDISDLIRYTTKALRNEGLGNLVKEMSDELEFCDYFSKIDVCKEYVDKANEVAEKKLDEKSKAMTRYKIKYRWHCEGYDGDSEDIVEANTLIDAYYIMQDKCLSAYRTFNPYSIEEVEE